MRIEKKDPQSKPLTFVWQAENSLKLRDECFELLSKIVNEEDIKSETIFKLKTLNENPHLAELFNTMVLKNKVIKEDDFWLNIESYKAKSL